MTSAGTRLASLALVYLLVSCLMLLAACDKQPASGSVLDEARRAGRTAASFVPADEDYFHDMDRDRNGPLALTPAEISGRNTWLVWTGGNDRFWDAIGTASGGALDFLKTLSSCPATPGVECNVKVSRPDRWKYLGLVNEPCFEAPTEPNEWGLWLDKRKPGCTADPFENAQKYPGVELCARGEKCNGGSGLPKGSFYGYASGVVGLRLFPNPDFDAAAQKKWNAEKYYNDPKYYFSKDLVKPYRVGMSCAFCHVGPNPINPPEDPENPQWANLSSNVGAQYFWVDRIFAWEGDASSYAYQMFHTSRPGALDTSLVSTDNVNNPRTMNALYGLGSRLEIARRWGKEHITKGGLNNKQFNDFVSSGPLTAFYQKPDTSWSPRVLKDGADSVGALGALNRVYLNIGLFSEEWLLHFNPLIGGKPTTPIEIAVARKNSSYWEATEQQTVNMALFFLKSTEAHRLQDAPGGSAYLLNDADKLRRGKIAFAERCARCHSSKIPEPIPALDAAGGCSGKGYLQCWNTYWERTKTEEYRAKMRELVLRDDFLDGNFLSTELRVPVTLLQTNACSPLATNAIQNNIWDNFSSGTYKELDKVGDIAVHDPLTGEPRTYAMPGGGRGYTRPASLISLWSTAPFLLNNSVGALNPGNYTVDANGYSRNPDVSVAARMRSFDDAIHQLLWPETRDGDARITQGFALGAANKKLPGLIDRTTQQSYLRVPTGYLPDKLGALQGVGARYAPWLFGEDGIEIGPIPAGTPVNLIANLDLLGDDPDHKIEHLKKVVHLLKDVKHTLKKLPENATDEQAREVFLPLVPKLLEFNKCPDFVVNRGHYFGTGYDKEPALSDDDKEALIGFLKTL
ncbi:MAG: hypothetical protein ABW106_03350 [Steroidobacteraceae bacterium]